MIPKLSLREIKKEATAHALAQAAYQLTVERGLDGFVVEDVVKRAGYSRRTFANHFSCKEEAVAMSALPYYARSDEESLIGDLPDSAPPLEVLLYWLQLPYSIELLRKLRELVSISSRHPTLEPYILSIFRRLLTEAHELLDSLFEGRYPAGYNRLLIGAVYGAMLPIFDGGLQVAFPGDTDTEAADSMTYDHYLQESFHYLRNGF